MTAPEAVDADHRRFRRSVVRFRTPKGAPSYSSFASPRPSKAKRVAIAVPLHCLHPRQPHSQSHSGTAHFLHRLLQLLLGESTSTHHVSTHGRQTSAPPRQPLWILPLSGQTRRDSTARISTMPWKNLDAIIEGRLYLGKWVLSFVICHLLYLSITAASY